MKKFHHLILSSLLFVLVVSAFSVNELAAHVSEGNMPDSVAEMEYRILLEFQPADIEVRNKLAMVLYRLDKLEEASVELQRVLEADPENFDALDAMGLVRFKQGNFQQALEYLQAAVRIDREDFLVHYHLGLAQAKLGMLDEAETSLKDALARNKEKDGHTDHHSNEIALIEKALAEVRAQKKEKND